MPRILFIALVFLTCIVTFSGASTLVLEGTIEDEVEVTQERTFSTPAGGLKTLSFRFAAPSSFNGGSVTQGISSHKLDFSPEPESVKAEKDSFGNDYTVVRWVDLKKDAKVRESYTVKLQIGLNGIKSGASFPIPKEKIPQAERRFLNHTALVESDNPEIKGLAASLTKGLDTEQASVMSILNWVIDNVKYKTPIPEYGALWTLKGSQGNCQNFSHLSIALLRAAGIPARIAGGLSLGKSWKVPLENGQLMQSIGQGGHAWLEVWYPDLGWVPYDAQQSHLFVGPRHVRQTAGLDSRDVNDSWRASPALPPYSENISAEYVKDNIALKLKETHKGPGSYIMAGSVASAIKVSPPKVEIEAPEVREAVFGNMDFPPLTDLYVKLVGDEGHKTFDKETAEYVSGEDVFAQAFFIKRPLKVETVSLAMHKFGGRLGSLWIDVVKDEGGRPGMEGIRSLPLALDTVSYFPGYKWFDFRFSKTEPERPVLEPGRYWIILRHSKDAIVNWFYTPGNAWGGPDDARSTERGIDWSNIMNYDFNFKVKGAYSD